MGLGMPLFEVCLEGDDVYSLRVPASDHDEAISKAMGIVAHVSEKNLPNYRVQVREVESDQPICNNHKDDITDQLINALKVKYEGGYN